MGFSGNFSVISAKVVKTVVKAFFRCFKGTENQIVKACLKAEKVRKCRWIQHFRVFIKSVDFQYKIFLVSSAFITPTYNYSFLSSAKSSFQFLENSILHISERVIINIIFNSPYNTFLKSFRFCNTIHFYIPVSIF